MTGHLQLAFPLPGESFDRLTEIKGRFTPSDRCPPYVLFLNGFQDISPDELFDRLRVVLLDFGEFPLHLNQPTTSIVSTGKSNYVKLTLIEREPSARVMQLAKLIEESFPEIFSQYTRPKFWVGIFLARILKRTATAVVQGVQQELLALGETGAFQGHQGIIINVQEIRIQSVFDNTVTIHHTIRLDGSLPLPVPVPVPVPASASAASASAVSTASTASAASASAASASAPASASVADPSAAPAELHTLYDGMVNTP